MFQVPAVLAMLAVAGAAPASGEAALWKAAFALEEPAPATRAAAETTLLRGGATALGVLAKVARTGGRSQALAASGTGTVCPELFPLGGFPQRRMEGSQLPGKAAELAGRMLVQNAALRRKAQTSEAAFDRGLALAAAARDPKLQAEALEVMRKEKDPLLRLWAAGFARCFVRTAVRRDGASFEALKAEAKALEEQSATVGSPVRCLKPEDLDPRLVEELAEGKASEAGWSSSGGTVDVMIQDSRGERIPLGPSCALALYDKLAAREKYVDALVVAVATRLQDDWALRLEAGRRAARDLERFPESKRNQVAVDLVNAGHPVPLKVTWRQDRASWDRDALEAAARQGHPDARAAIEQVAFCRVSQEEVALLGYLGTKEAAETAHAFARRCPESLGFAVAALVRLKDARAVELLPRALESFGSGQEALGRAVLDAYSPELRPPLLAAVEKGSGPARDLVQLLKDAGVMKE